MNNLIAQLLVKSVEELSEERDRLLKRLGIMVALRNSGEAPIDKEVLAQVDQLVQIYSVTLAVAAAADASGATKH
tara:strand:+ start:160 stop:384 length:225 start_codon:yes stop_codon:yes gene_type:complete